MLRIIALFAGLLALAACTNANDLNQTPTYLGDFHLGHNVVVAPNLTKGPASREASEEEWAMVMTKAIGDRFGRYEGEAWAVAAIAGPARAGEVKVIVVPASRAGA